MNVNSDQAYEKLSVSQRSTPKLTSLGHDLLQLTTLQRTRTVALPIVWIVALFVFAAQGWWPAVVLAAAGYTFTSFGSTSHDLVHGNLGLPTWLNHTLLSFIELLGLRSGHAYWAAHRHHHARYPHDDDIEGAAAHGSLVQSLLAGPFFVPRIWCWGVIHAPRYRAVILLEGLACLTIIVGAIGLYPLTPIPLVYVTLVILGSWTFPLITAYLPHDPHGAGVLQQTLRFRGRVLAWVFFDHFYHLEHHLYPAVPHIHWPLLAARLDSFLDRNRVQAIYWNGTPANLKHDRTSARAVPAR